jgi:tetratricopeptide (TPR) repeat protein
MKKLFFFILLSAVGLHSYGQSSKDRIPVSTRSKSALSFYNEAMNYFEDVALDKGRDLLNKALEEDKDFFMANYQMALYYSWTGNFQNFIEYAGAAVNCKAELSEAEELLRSAIAKLRQDLEADVTEYGKKLVEMYPRDVNSYNNLIYFQSFKNDLEGELETIDEALKIARNPAPFYNQQGYVYMSLKQNDKAEAAFNRYIEADPRNPNVYDSKGDYYMSIRDYRKAYESYMKAFSIDTAWSIEKAQRAKQLYERTEGRKIEIIPM